MLKEFAIAIPTYNEAANIKLLLPKLNQRYPGIKIFVVDDNSPDGTAEIVEELAKRFPHTELMKRPHKQGLASAYLHAFGKILLDKDTRYIVTMDADFSHDLDDLTKLLNSAAHYDLVVGSRYVPGGNIENWGLWRRALSRFGNLYARRVTGIPLADLTAGFVLYRRDLLERILKSGIESGGYAYQIEMKYLAYRHGAKMKEVPITFRERVNGKSKLSNAVVFEGVIAPWHLRFFRS